MKSVAKTIVGMIGAATVGAAVGVAFAPDKGTKTRTKIKRGIEDAVEDLKSFADTAKEKTLSTAHNVIDSGKKNVTKLVETVSSKV